MSYSFSVRGNSVQEVRDLSDTEINKVTQQQPVHARDQIAVKAAVSAFLDAAGEPRDDQSVQLHVSGSVSGFYTDEANENFDLTNVGINVNVAFVKREDAE